MDIKSLLSAVFLRLQANERGLAESEFLDNFATDDVIELAEKIGEKELAKAFKESNEGIDWVGSACDADELQKAEYEYRKATEKIEQNI